ncbi:MAG: regulatory iron-sulfur-containing complex subunit RicT, partial [Gemmatimonadales bacterium]|nr:regulatory iron-sulfur-containing complex subunit RicT [Gemmatimonadales bacterium]
MPQTVEVRFKGTRKAYFHWEDEAEPLHMQEAVVVEAERGSDLGRVTAVGPAAEAKCAGACTGCAVGEAQSQAAEPVRRVLRRAAQPDLAQHAQLRRQEEADRRTIIAKVRAHGLPMKISDTEWQWDRSRLTVYFTAETRVDFRHLVRELGSSYRTRIDLRQIGSRQEAARLGGVGRCGREYCCSTWLTEPSPVSLGLAKDQHLSLNPQQISGGCGRLLCCLKYEHEFYVQSRKRFPREGKTLALPAGPAKVVAIDIFRERVFLRTEAGPRIITLVELQEELAAPATAPAAAPDQRAAGGLAEGRTGGPAQRPAATDGASGARPAGDGKRG